MNTKITRRIFITGIYRSGTTLVSRILGNHPKIWITYDSVHFMRFSYGRFDPISDPRNMERLLGDTNNRIFKRWKMQFNADEIMRALFGRKKVSYGLVYDCIMSALALRHKNGIVGWGEKTNVCWGQIPNFLNMFPGGKVLHILRDPRDVMCSYRDMTYEPGLSYLDSAFCSLDAFARTEEYRSNLSADNYYAFRYEDMVDDPEKEIRKICDFLGVCYEEEMLNTAMFRDPSGRRWYGDSSFDRKVTTISKGPMGRWRGSAKPFEIFFVELINRDAMKRFGYELSGISIGKAGWDRLYGVLNNDRLLSKRYKHWLKTGEGNEGYPSSPLA